MKKENKNICNKCKHFIYCENTLYYATHKKQCKDFELDKKYSKYRRNKK